MPLASTGFTRILENLYTRVFEQSPPRLNRRVSDVVTLSEQDPADTATVAFNIGVKARAYEDLSLTGSTGVQGDGSYRLQSGTRVNYGPGVMDDITGAAVFRFEVLFNSGAAGTKTLLSLHAGGTDGLRIQYVGGGTNEFQIVRTQTSGQSAVVSGGSFTSGDSLFIKCYWNSTTLAIGLNAAAMTTNGSTNDPAGTMTTVDIGNDDNTNFGDVDMHWMAIFDAVLTDAEADALNAGGDTDFDWEAHALEFSLAWLCDDLTHEEMSSRAGEANAAA
jgi:hypothetical protein